MTGDSTDQTFLDIGNPTLGRDEIDAVMRVLESGHLSTGPKVAELEEQFQSSLPCAHAVAVSSATAGLQLALNSLRMNGEDEVITTPLTFVSTANTIVHAGAKPVFVDIDLDTYTLDPIRIARAINNKTKAIVPVHFAGIPVDMDPLITLGFKNSVRVIEDASHALGSRYKGQSVGSFGDTAVFSFDDISALTTGEGGLIVTLEQSTADYCRRMSLHGFTVNEETGQVDVTEPGHKFNMTDMQAAIGLVQLKKLNEFQEKRTTLAELYMAKMHGWDQFVLPKKPKYDCAIAWNMFSPRLNLETVNVSRDDFIANMKAQGIEVGVHYPAVHLFSYYREKYGYEPGMCPNAEAVAESIVTLPLNPTMTEEDVDRVLKAADKALK